MADPPIGSVFAGYRIDALAGRGGMGVVYRAWDVALERPVALKLIAPERADLAGFRRRFIRESKVAASLDHPNIIPIYHAGEQDGTLFLVMRFVDGEDLRTLVERERTLPPARTASIVAQVAAALDAAHARGLVHRDVKPGNVLLAHGEHAYLTDFGLSKRLEGDDDDDTTTHGLVGTMSYIAPEQIRGETLDSRTDVYALGCVVFRLLTGSVPFPMETDEAKLWAHLSTAPPLVSERRPELGSSFDAAVDRALKKDKADRYRSCCELAQDVLAAAREPATVSLAVAGAEQRAQAPVAPAPEAEVASQAGDPPATWEAVVTADREYFDRVAAAGVEFPVASEPRTFALDRAKLSIGRRSASRGVEPEIDLSATPEDPAVSRLHAIVARRADGSYEVIDPGSTNGTTINDDLTPIATNVPVRLGDGDRIHIGAWTTIEVRRR